MNAKFLLLFFTQLTISQNIQVVDSLTKEKIPFVVVNANSEYFYSDINGKIELNKLKSDSLSISCMGYNDKRIHLKNIKNDTVFLTGNIFMLNEVVVSNKAAERKKIGILKKSKIMSSIFLNFRQEFIIHIKPSTENLEKKVVVLNIPLNKIKLHNQNDKFYKNRSAYYRINVYSDIEKNILIYKSEPITFDLDKKSEINYKFKEPICLTANGVYFGIELIKTNSDSHVQTNSDYIRPYFTNSITKEFEAVSYLRGTTKNRELGGINAIIAKEYTKSNIFNFCFSIIIED